MNSMCKMGRRGHGLTRAIGKRSAFVETLEPRRLLSGTATLQGRVFDDRDSDLEFSPGERGLGGAVVWVDLNSNGKLDSHEPRTVSANDGTYEIDDVPTGVHDVWAALRHWELYTSFAGPPFVQLKTGSVATCDMAMQRDQFVQGTVFNDANLNSIRDPHEGPVVGAVIRIAYGDFSDGTPSTAVYVKTDANGHYQSFVPIEGYDFDVEMLPSAGYRISTGGSMTSYPIIGDDSETFDVAATHQGLIYGVVFADNNDNGVFDSDSGESVLPGSRVFIDANGNGRQDAGEQFEDIPFEGDFQFNPLAPGRTYRVVVVNTGSLTPTTKTTYVVQLSSGQVTELKFGFSRPQTVSGTVYYDSDGDGHRSAAESAASGLTVFADTNNNGKPDPDEPSTIIDEAGRYTLHTIGHASRAIVVIPKTGWRMSKPYHLRLRGDVSNFDLGLTQFGTINVQLFDDDNANGKKDPGEDFDPDLPFEIWLDDNNNHNPDDNELSDWSPNWASRINTLSPGTYRVGVFGPDNWRFTTPGQFELVQVKPGQVTEVDIGMVEAD